MNSIVGILFDVLIKRLLLKQQNRHPLGGGGGGGVDLLYPTSIMNKCLILMYFSMKKKLQHVTVELYGIMLIWKYVDYRGGDACAGQPPFFFCISTPCCCCMDGGPSSLSLPSSLVVGMDVEFTEDDAA